MKDEEKTKEQIIKELTEARQRINELELLEAEIKQAISKRDEVMKMASDMMENIPAGVIITDMSGRMVDINRAITEKTGYTKEDVVGKTPLEVGVTEKEQVSVLKTLIKMFNCESVIGAKLNVVRKDGSEFPALLDISVLKDPDGSPISGIVVLKDPIQSEQMEQQLDDRELEILRLIANGINTKEISTRFGLSQATIKRIVSSIMEKFGVRNRSEAVSEAYKRNLI